VESRQEFDRLLAYDRWANAEALASLQRAGTPPTRAVRFLAHILGAELMWLSRLERVPPEAEVWPVWDVAECRRQLSRVDARWNSYAGTLTASGLATTVPYRNTRGEEFENAVEEILTQVFLHSAYHRGQIASTLRDAGHEPALTDFIHALRTGELAP